MSISDWFRIGKNSKGRIKEDEPVASQRDEIEQNGPMFPNAGVNYRMTPGMMERILNGADCDEVADPKGAFGFSPLNAIPVNGILGEIKYLARLQCSCGCGILFHRLVSAKWRGADIDVFEAVCLRGKHWNILFLDFYHPRRSRKLPQGYKALPYNEIISKSALAFGTNKRVERFPFDLPPYIERHTGNKSVAEDCKALIEKADFQRPAPYLELLREVERAIDAPCT